MDCENASNESTTVEEKTCSTLKTYPSNISVEVEKESPESNVGTAPQKETIEILKVELVASRTDHSNADGTKDEYMENIPVIETEKLCSELNSGGQEVFSDIYSDKTIGENSDLVGVNVTNGLSLLSQYQSDDDSDSVIEVPITSAQDYRNQVVEINSASDSDDSSDSSDVEYLNDLRKTIEKRIVVGDEDEEDDDNEENTSKKRHYSKLRVKGEMLLEDLPPIQDLQITVPEDKCIEFGKIHSIVDQLVLVGALPNSILLNLETIIFLEKGQKVLGEVFDVLGQVADPLYCVRFNSNKQIKEKQINVGDLVYVAPKTQYTQYVILSNLMNVRGSDASWENDVEPPPRFLDYSDDEQEQLARRQLRNKDKPMDNDDQTKRPRTGNDGSTSNRSHNSNTPHNNRYANQRNNSGIPLGRSNARPRYDGPPQNQQDTANHNRSSWHSNYYPQPLPHNTAGTYGMYLPHNQTRPPQAFAPNMHMYSMPPARNMPYPPPESTQYGAPPMFHQHGTQPIPNAFSIRPPTIQGSPYSSHYQEYSSTPPPPPPGSQ